MCFPQYKTSGNKISINRLENFFFFFREMWWTDNNNKKKTFSFRQEDRTETVTRGHSSGI